MTHWRRLPKLTSNLSSTDLNLLLAELTSTQTAETCCRRPEQSGWPPGEFPGVAWLQWLVGTDDSGRRRMDGEVKGGLCPNLCFSRWTSDQAELVRHLVAEHQNAGRSPPAIDQINLDNYWTGRVVAYLASVLRGRRTAGVWGDDSIK